MVKRHTPELDALFKRTRVQLTQQRGSLGRLADCLGVSQPTLSDWLRGRYEPGGEVTLKLQQWVNAAEAKQKETPTVLVAQSGRKTRSAKSTINEKVKPDRQK